MWRRTKKYIWKVNNMTDGNCVNIRTMFSIIDAITTERESRILFNSAKLAGPFQNLGQLTQSNNV